MKYTVDTNIVSFLLRGNLPARRKLIEAGNRGDEIVIAPLVHYEIRRGFLTKPAPTKERLYRAFVEKYPIGEMTEEWLERGAEIYAALRRENRTVADVDLLIAAFCLVGGYTLVTNNVRHFRAIVGLGIEDWSAEPA